MSTYSDSKDILAFSMPELSCGEDEDGNEAVPPIPPFCVPSPKPNLLLSKLPLEVLEEITRYLSESSLSVLSLVSKDCCQLARSCRFRSVRFDYSIPQSHLIQKLSEEAREHVSNNGSTASPSIGTCFRRLRIPTDCRDVSETLEDDEMEKRASQTYSLFFSDYLSSLGLILARALPNLVYLDICNHDIPLTRSFFNVLARSSVQHLKLERVYVDEEFGIVLPKALAHRGWPLRTLHLLIWWSQSSGKHGSTAPLCTSILKLCAPTLEKFAWTSPPFRGEDHSQTLAKEVLPRLVQLRELVLRVQFSDRFTIKWLELPQLESRLKVLEADGDERSFIGQYLDSCGTIRSLETFVWQAIGLNPNDSFDFLRHNSQLSKLSIPWSQSPIALDEGILPMLSQSFQNLKSLSLTWNENSISTTALQLIGTLRGLQQIHLSTGRRHGRIHDWAIKHQEMRKYLKELRHLKKLAFSRDSYEGRQGFENDYYRSKRPIYRVTLEDLPGLDEADPDKQTDIIWERQHRRRILAEADDYVRVLPRLEWMYFGKIRMAVVNTRECQGRHAVALSQEIDDWYQLEGMFGRDTDDF
ncbi:hypothetical protein MMC07_000563 [Pseudocyphellaria aurata]|nr:hypothetical protein [Pseudocyphellaria aurata]